MINATVSWRADVACPEGPARKPPGGCVLPSARRRQAYT